MKVRLVAMALICAAPAAASDRTDIPASMKSDSSGELPPRVKASGTAFRTIAWSDDKGDNLAVFSTTTKTKSKGAATLQSKSIFVDLFVGKDGRYRKGRTVREVVANCDRDLTNEFLDTSVVVSDLDDNGVGELTFAYRWTCRGDVAPADMKLVVIEGPRTYVLRGTTRVRPGGGAPVGGDFAAEFTGAPPKFLEHASKAWKRFVDE